MSCNHNNNSSYCTNLASAARQNHKEKHTVVKGAFLKVNVMCIPFGGEIGVEVHDNEDQLITIVCGNATVKLGNTRCTADCIKHLNARDSVFIPAGTWHNVCNTGNGPLKLISVYAYGNQVCTQGGAVACTQNVGCGCAQAVTTGCNTVYNASDYNWNTAQAQDEDCGCRTNSGC